MTYIKLGVVRAFPGARPDKAQALEVLEGAGDTLGFWKEWDSRCWSRTKGPAKRTLLMKLADTIQACANLAAALGVEDLTPYLAECEERNRERGRYGR